MRFVKMLGLAMAAAIAAMAFVGAGTASATTPYLCEAGTYAACGGETSHTLAVGTTFTSVLQEGKAELEGAINVQCEESSVSGELTKAAEQGTQIHGKITAVTWKKCNSGCTAVATQLPWSFHVEQQKSNAAGEQDEVNGTYIGNGKMWVNPEPQGNTEASHQPGGKITCLFGTVVCAYHVNETQPGETANRSGYLHLKGGKPARLHASKILLKYDPTESKSSESTCGAEGHWSGQYKIASIKQPTLPEVTEPSLWVAHTEP